MSVSIISVSWLEIPEFIKLILRGTEPNFLVMNALRKAGSRVAE